MALPYIHGKIEHIKKMFVPCILGKNKHRSTQLMSPNCVLLCLPKFIYNSLIYQDKFKNTKAITVYLIYLCLLVWVHIGAVDTDGGASIFSIPFLMLI